VDAPAETEAPPLGSGRSPGPPRPSCPRRPEGEEVSAGELLASTIRSCTGCAPSASSRARAVAMLLPNSREVFELYLAVLQAGFYSCRSTGTWSAPRSPTSCRTARRRRSSRTPLRRAAQAAANEIDFPAAGRISVGGDIPGLSRLRGAEGGQPRQPPRGPHHRRGHELHLRDHRTPERGAPPLPGLAPEAMAGGFAGCFLFQLQPFDDNVHIAGRRCTTPRCSSSRGRTHIGQHGGRDGQVAPEQMLALIDQYGVTNTHMVPTQFVRLLALGDDVKAATTCRRCVTWSTRLARARPT